MTFKLIPLVAAFLAVTAVPIMAQDAGPVLRIIETEDQIVEVRAKTRHTTVIVLPVTESILDFVVGDSEYWHLTGAANLAFLKPIAEGVTTNVALVCASGRIYSFLVTESSTVNRHLVVRIDTGQDTDPRIAPGAHEPAYDFPVPGGGLSGHGRNRDADGQGRGVDRAEYPTRLKFPYRLENKAREWPFLVEGMWHDGRFTYLRSNAQESPALYEEKDVQPALVAYDLQEDGLYIARHVLGNGYLQIGKQRVRWRFTAPEVGR